MSGIRKFSMRSQCYEIIKEKILSGEYKLGECINITNLSAELEVSNTPIREALTQLESDGLVTSTLNIKAQVIDFTPESFKDIADTVYILVKGAYELCLEESKLDKLVEMLKKSLILQEKHLNEGDYYEYTKELVYFDQIIFEVLDNPHLLFVFNRISQVLFLMYRTNHERNNWELSRSIAEHSEIVKAMEAGETTLTDKLIREHYHQSYVEK